VIDATSGTRRQDAYDVCIIGSGAGGGMAAYALTRAGARVVMLEAGLCGLPVLAADLEGIRDVVREGESGHLVPSRDAAAFVETVLRYHADRAALTRASASAARHVADTFSWRSVADRYLRVLRSGTLDAAASTRRAAPR